MIKDVEEKFVYPSEAKHLTRDWVLMTLCKRWRAYKSDQENLQLEVRMVKDNVEDVKDDVKDAKDDVKDINGDVKGVKDDVGDVKGQMAMIAASLAKKFPGESWRNERDSITESYHVTLPERGNNLQCESYNVLQQSNDDVQEPQTTMQELQQTKSKEVCSNVPLPHEHVITKNAHAEHNLGVQNGGPEPSLRPHQVTKQNANAENSNATKPRGHHQVTKQDKTEVVLYSMNLRNKDKPVAKGNLGDDNLKKECINGARSSSAVDVMKRECIGGVARS